MASSFSLQLPRIFTTLQIPLLVLNNVFALAVPPEYHVLRLGFSFPILVVLVAQSWYREPEGTWGDQYGFECLVLTLACVWLDWIGVSTPDREKWRRFQYNHGQKKETGNGTANGKANGVSKVEDATYLEPYPTSFGSRLWWAMRMATTMRYVGWTSEAKNTPREVDPSYPRGKFVLRKIGRAILFYLARDIIYSYSASTPHGTWEDIAHKDIRTSFFDSPFWTRVLYIWAQITLTYLSLELMNTVNGIVQVTIGIANPRDCPSAFGDLKELITVRQAWAFVWHQQVRRFAGDPGIYLARDILGLRKGSFASKYLQLFVGFAISGAMHAGASMLIHRSLEGDAAMTFFIGQACIIMIEDHVIDFGKHLGFKNSIFWRLVGFGWVVLALGISLQVWQGRVIDRGLWVHHREKDLLGIGPQI